MTEPKIIVYHACTDADESVCLVVSEEEHYYIVEPLFPRGWLLDRDNRFPASLSKSLCEVLDA